MTKKILSPPPRERSCGDLNIEGSVEGIDAEYSLAEDDVIYFSGIVPFYIVRKPVHCCRKAVVDSVVEFTPEVSKGIFFRYGQEECFPQVTNVIK